MAHKRGRAHRPWLIGTAAVVLGFMAARLAGRFIAPAEDEDSIDDNAPRKLLLRLHERRYPPFYDREAQGIRVEGEFDQAGARQLVIIGIDQTELNKAMLNKGSHFAMACGDSAGLWRPAVAEKALLYGQATDQRGEVYAVAAAIGPSILAMLPGVMLPDGHFSPFKSSRILALTNADGLLYDYPNVPVIEIVD